ncbi:restriction endonuclease subunit S [Novilysobacter erysipheiresistens]|uniref:Restriction endonuclease subunit S n=1 Tax=Novilysobacter erysipheiresistens TaxID=1749332 RepID=A0ABU7YW75_9GAMM
MTGRRQEAIYDLPLRQFGTDCHWHVQSLADAAFVMGGGTPDTGIAEFWNPPEIPWATPTDITGTQGNEIRTTERSISEAGLKQSTLVPSNSVLMTSRATIGVAKINRVPMAINQGFAALCPKEGYSTEYLFHLLDVLRPTLLRLGAGTTFLEASRREIRKVRLRMPDTNEQQRIAAALKLADDAIVRANVEWQAARKLKSALLSELLQTGLPGKHAKIVQSKKLKHPKGWTVAKLGKCGEWTAGGTPDRATKSFYEGSIPWVKSGEVNYCVVTETEEHLSEEGVSQTTCGVLPAGTLLIAMYGAGVTRGKVALLGIPASTNQAVAAFNGHAGIENEFVYYWFELNYQRVRSWAAGSNQDNLSGFLLKGLPIALPDHDEQMQIVKILKASDSAISALSEKIEALETVKRSLVQNLLTGKLRLPQDTAHA